MAAYRGGFGFADEVALYGLVSGISSCAIMFGGVVPFLPQYREIRATRNADGFSTFVCLTLIIANVLRICFWFGKQFETPLLVQSIIMIFIMLAMVELCVRVKNEHELVAVKSRSFFDFDPKYFWKWSDFPSYVIFVAGFSAAGAIMTYVTVESILFVETLGFLAVMSEAMLAVPQLWRNFQKKSTIGMSVKMVFFLFVGDVFKTAYFILRNAPAQFWICGTLQVGIDVAIFFQVYYYAATRYQHAS